MCPIHPRSDITFPYTSPVHFELKRTLAVAVSGSALGKAPVDPGCRKHWSRMELLADGAGSRHVDAGWHWQ